MLDTRQERERALGFVMRIAGPEETMHPRALALYREFETMLGGAREQAPEATIVPAQSETAA